MLCQSTELQQMAGNALVKTTNIFDNDVNY